MAEFVPASRGQSNLNTVLGTIGTVGTLAGAMGNNCNGGLFSNLFGNNCNNNCNNQQTYVDALQAEIAKLNSEKYSDRAAANAYRDAVLMAEKLDSKWTAQLGEVTREVADMRVREASTNGRIDCIEQNNILRQQLNDAKINEVALTCSSGINTLTATVNCLAQTLSQITKTVIPNGVICPGWGDIRITPTPAPTTPASPAA